VNLYLVRHGEAVPKHWDPARPLTRIGAARARRIARFLGRAGLNVAEIRHSTKLRARQTAEIIAQEAGLSAPVREVAGLEPEAEVGDLAATLSGASSGLMLVGHLPHLSRLTSMLVTGDADLEAFVFEDCSVLCLQKVEGAEGAGWTVRWMLAPSLLSDTPSG
jgi:phosphohistidine phosphatase